MRGEEGGERREGDITKDHWLVMSTGKLSAESPLGWVDISHFTSVRTQNNNIDLEL